VSSTGLFDLNGRVAVVIGAGGYLCSTLSAALADHGARVVALDMKDPLEAHPELAGKVAGSLACDVTSKDELVRVREWVLGKFGRVDILLNGAGTNAPLPFLDISGDEIDRVLGVNIKAVIFSCQVFGESMLAQGRGSIINFASASSGPPLSKAFVYSIAKSGVVSLTQNLGREWATKGVRVNALRPGFFPTQWSMDHFIDAERKRRILEHTPMNRFGTPDELIGATIYLASDASQFVTGSVVAVDGGFTAMTI
jgi:NAD(P)-dependent dehydrogenase (short-subunit alcohol dehydrogenase family)